MRNSSLWLGMGLVLIAVAGGAEEPVPTLAERLQALETAVQAKDLATVYTQAHALVTAASAPTALTPADKYAVALAQYYLAAESLQLAMAQGLDLAQTRRALAVLTAMGITAAPAGVADVKLIQTGGQELDIKEFLVPGKTTVIDLFSPHCGWCVKYLPKLAGLAQSRPDLAVVELNLDRPGAKRIDTGSPLGKQYHVVGVPHLKVFGPDGQLLAEGAAAPRLLNLPIK